MEKEKYEKIFESLNQYESEEKYLEELVNLISKILYERTTFIKNSNNDVLRENFYKKLKEIIKNTYEDYKIKNNLELEINSIIEFIGCGHTSLAFRIGNVVIKIGKEGFIPPIKNNYNLPCLIPLFYKKIFKVDDKENYNVQITPLVDTNLKDEEEVYKVYKSLRKFGYIWNDPKLENIGIIKKDITLNDITYKKGDYVILDLEDLAYVGEITPESVLDEITYTSYNQKTYVYETRYIEEKEKIK